MLRLLLLVLLSLAPLTSLGCCAEFSDVPQQPAGGSVFLASTVRPVPASTVDVSREAVTVLEGATEEASTLRVWTDQSAWWTGTFAGVTPQWQATAILEEQTAAGLLVRTAPLRPRGVAFPVSGAVKYTVKVLLAWIGAGPVPTPQGRVYASVTSGSPRWHEIPAGRVFIGGLVTLTPDQPGESGTFNGVRFCAGLRLSWTNNAVAIPPSFILDGQTIPCPATWGNVVVDVLNNCVLQGGGDPTTVLSASWIVYE